MREFQEGKEESPIRTLWVKPPMWRHWYDLFRSPRCRWILFLLLPFLTAALIFTFVIRTSDPANVGNFQFASSYLVLSLNPYTALTFPPPPNYFSFLLPQYWVYQASWNVYDSTIVLKFWSIAATLILGLFVYRISLKCTGSEAKSRAAVIAVVASPFIFFTSFIEAGQDVVGLAVAVAGLYFLIPLTNSDDFPKIDLALGSGLLAYGVFLYYFPVIIAWSLIVFSKSRRNAISAAVAFGSWMAFFSLTYAFGGFWQFFTNFAGTTQATGSLPVYSILNLASPGLNSPFGSFTPLTEGLSNIMLGLGLGAVIILPVTFRLAGRSVLLSIATTMALPFLLTKITNGDELVWVVPFATLFLVTELDAKHVQLWLLLSQCWMLPEFIVLNMWIAPGYGAGTGVFYFTYLQFHNSTVVYSLFPHPFAVSKLLDLAAFLCLSSTLFTMVWMATRVSTEHGQAIGRSDPLMVRESDLQSVHEPREFSNNPKAGSRHSLRLALRTTPAMLRASRRSLSVYVVICLVLAAALTLVPATRTTELTYSGTEPFPIGLFVGIPIQNPSLTYTFLDNGQLLQIANGTGPAGPIPASFHRSLYGQSIDVAFDMETPSVTDATFVDPVAHIGSNTVSYVGQLTVPSPGSLIAPNYAENSTSFNASSPIVRGPPMSMWTLSGYSVRQYMLNLSRLEAGALTLFFDPNPVSYGQNLVFYNRLPNESQEMFVLGGTLYFGVQVPGLPWTYYPEITLGGAYSWHSLIFEVSPSCITFYLDGKNIHVAITGMNSTMLLDVGAFLPGSRFYDRYAFSGTASALFEFATNQLGYGFGIAMSPSNSTNDTAFKMLGNDSGRWSFSYSGQAPGFSGNGGTFSGIEGAPLLSFGRFAAESPSLDIRILSLELISTQSDNTLERVMVLSMGTPVALVVIGIDSRIVRGRTRGPEVS